MTQQLFITGPSTGAGKTLVGRALSAALTARGRRVLALKPIETGVDPDPLDALALAHAAHRPADASAPGLYRARAGLAPYAVELEREAPPIDLPALAATVRSLAAAAAPDVLLVEGAGGLLVPLDARHDVADMARLLGLPLLLVARDQLGVLSYVITCFEAARARALPVAGVVLCRHPADRDDPSLRTNHRILQRRLDCPVRIFPPVHPTDDAHLAAAAEAAGLLGFLEPA